MPSLTAEAEYQADLEELALACAECFAGARCAGLSVSAIGQTARAAAILGAPLGAIQARMTPFGVDTEYLDRIEEVREALRQKAAGLRDFIRGAKAVKHLAAAGMRRALRERDYAAYMRYQQEYLDAANAVRIAGDAVRDCREADRCLAWARVRFAEAYEGAESDVARGHQLPHEGRWITGEKPSLPSLIGGSARTVSDGASL